MWFARRLPFEQLDCKKPRRRNGVIAGRWRCGRDLVLGWRVKFRQDPPVTSNSCIIHCFPASAGCSLDHRFVCGCPQGAAGQLPDPLVSS